VPSISVSASIELAEATLRATLPESFRRFLLEQEPRELEILGLVWDLNPVFETNVGDFSRHRGSAIVAETMDARAWDGFPAGAIAVGSDGCGNYLVFLPNELQAGLKDELYIWWHEGPELEFVAGDFSEVLPRSNTSFERTREG